MRPSGDPMVSLSPCADGTHAESLLGPQKGLGLQEDPQRSPRLAQGWGSPGWGWVPQVLAAPALQLALCEESADGSGLVVCRGDQFPGSKTPEAGLPGLCSQGPLWVLACVRLMHANSKSPCQQTQQSG